MLHYKSRILTLAVAGTSTLAMIGLPLNVLAAPSTTQSQNSTYMVHLNQLNGSGVSGTAVLKYKPGTGAGDEQLKVDLTAFGTTPDQTHPAHIHGDNDPEVAMCPTTAVDTNNDGFISVVEGAATYGPIKVNLTSPQTPFGASPTPALFTPFAGTADNKNFPMANQNGKIGLHQKYTFDTGAAARGALQSITPLEHQHIVVHGAMAPAGVDADAFAALGAPVTGSKDAVVYDPLLPIACGEIQKTGMQDPSDSGSLTANAVTNFHSRISTLRQNYTTASQAALTRFNASSKTAESRDQYVAATQSARDMYVNQFYEARNKFVDQLNQTGSTAVRDSVSAQAQTELDSFSNTFEAAKQAFVNQQ